MAFVVTTAAVKDELARLPVVHPGARRAELSAVLRFAGRVPRLARTGVVEPERQRRGGVVVSAMLAAEAEPTGGGTGAL